MATFFALKKTSIPFVESADNDITLSPLLSSDSVSIQVLLVASHVVVIITLIASAYPLHNGIILPFDIIQEGREILQLSPAQLESRMRSAFKIRTKGFGRTLYCYGPTSYPYNIKEHQQKSKHNFPSFSVTGTSCALQCEHCSGQLLRGMDATLSPDELLSRFSEIAEKGGTGALVSGGSDGQGRVPLLRFGDAIAQGKEMGLDIVVHTGIVDESTAEMLAAASVDAVMLDIIGDSQVMKQVYHLRDGVKAIRASLDILHAHRLPIVPHILVGLNYGELSGELNAIDMVSGYDPAGLVVIALSPLPKTPMEHIQPPAPETIGRIMTVARFALPKTPLLLGCARPMGEHKIHTDRYAVDSGANGIAYVSQEGVDYAREQSLEPVFQDVCCSLASQAYT
ncbi:radical SAM protein [Candidatus Thorarchaeota archaeon]|nr:MAG: radical SAM protein [Candidatus Thorarchaeota archaeon]